MTALLTIFPLLGSAQEGGQASLTLSGGMAVAPLYQGASTYSAVPLYDMQASYEGAAWGDFGIGLGVPVGNCRCRGRLASPYWPVMTAEETRK